jgi:hypothetical protein
MSNDHVPDRMEIFINEQRADLELFRLLLQMCFAQFLDGLPTGRGPAYLTAFENDVVQTLKTAPLDEEFQRMKEMMIARTEKFFLAIRKAKGYPIQNMGEGQKRN